MANNLTGDYEAELFRLFSFCESYSLTIIGALWTPSSSNGSSSFSSLQS